MKSPSARAEYQSGTHGPANAWAKSAYPVGGPALLLWGSWGLGFFPLRPLDQFGLSWELGLGLRYPQECRWYSESRHRIFGLMGSSGMHHLARVFLYVKIKKQYDQVKQTNNLIIKKCQEEHILAPAIVEKTDKTGKLKMNFFFLALLNLYSLKIMKVKYSE